MFFFGRGIETPLKLASKLLQRTVIAVAGVILSACANNTEPSPASVLGVTAKPLLNSERIQRQFGSFGIDVINANDRLRVSNLHSHTNGQKICRTFAVVQYPKFVDPAYAGEHQRIVMGESLGAVFKSSGWSIQKKSLYFGEFDVTESDTLIQDLMGTVSTASLAVHSYVLVVANADAQFDYATITEVHHPDYLGLRDLRALYGRDVSRYSERSNKVNALLRTTRDAMRQTE